MLGCLGDRDYACFGDRDHDDVCLGDRDRDDACLGVWVIVIMRVLVTVIVVRSIFTLYCQYNKIKASFSLYQKFSSDQYYMAPKKTLLAIKT